MKEKALPSEDIFPSLQRYNRIVNWVPMLCLLALRSVVWSRPLDNLLPKDEVVLVRLAFWLVCMRSRHHLRVQNIRVIWYNILVFCRRHAWRWSNLLCKYSVVSRIVFHNTTSPYQSFFVRFKLFLQFHTWTFLPSNVARRIISVLRFTFWLVLNR